MLCQLQNYKNLAQDIQSDPYSKARTIYDILNEPDARSLGWSDITPIYLSIMDAIYAINSSALIDFNVLDGQNNDKKRFADAYRLRSCRIPVRH